MNHKRIKQIREDIQALINKVNHLLRVEDQVVSEVVTDLLSSARYVLKLHLPKEPAVPAKRTRLYDQDDEVQEQEQEALPDPSGDIEYTEADLTPESQRERSKRRNLREEWSGSLPPLPVKKRKRVGIDVDRNGVSGPDPDHYEVVRGSPSALCPDCRGPISGHPVDKNAEADGEGNKPRIACDSTRVYCGRVD